MNIIEKFDLYLTQLIFNTKNRLNDDSEVIIGKLNENLTYVNNDPLTIKINKNNANLYECKIGLDSNLKFDIQYIHRIYNTPFYVSYLSNNDFNLKIVDFYEWYPQTFIYRLFIFKKVNFESINQTIKLNLEINNDLKNVAKDEIHINETALIFSGKINVDSNKINTEISTNTNTFSFAYILKFNKNNESSSNLEFIIKKFHELHAKCRSSHISNLFLTKNLKAEKELDELWNQQKFILPDLKFDDNLTEDRYTLSMIKFWVKDFYSYFNIENDLSDQNTYISKDAKGKFNSTELLNYHLTKTEILHYYLNSDFQNEELEKKIQEWWDIYSLPLFEKSFAVKSKKNPEEVFTVYFLAIRFKLPWASLMFEHMENSILSSGINPLHNFLFLLCFLYKRIIKINTKNNTTFYSPGYYWDNNYKALIDYRSKQKYENTKFSNNAFVKITKNNSLLFKINKLCRIIFNENNKKISIFPLLNDGINKLIIKNHIIISLDDFTIKFPLVWEQGFLEFKYLKLKWLLKKNRFQFTLHSLERKTILLNDEPLKLFKEKKLVYYLEVSQDKPQFYLSLFNKKGGTQFSRISQQVNPVIISGFATTRYGTITDNILFSKNIRKQRLFLNNLICKDISIIPIEITLPKINFYSKHNSNSVNIPYIHNEFVDSFVHLKNANKEIVLLLIDSIFKNSIKIILMFFERNFGFQPEYYLFDENSKMLSRSNLVIEFKYKKDFVEVEKCFYKTRNHLTIIGEDANTILVNLRELLIENIKNWVN